MLELLKAESEFLKHEDLKSRLDQFFENLTNVPNLDEYFKHSNTSSLDYVFFYSEDLHSLVDLFQQNQSKEVSLDSFFFLLLKYLSDRTNIRNFEQNNILTTSSKIR